tara:strand:+ start:5500 stop:6672 length:1173 start_codon:yes stop_codon:yes gene_type:complete
MNRSTIAELIARENARFSQSRPRSAKLVEEATEVMPSGVPMAWMRRLTHHATIYVDKGSGAHFTDIDGHSYVDFNQGDMSSTAGYGTPAVVEAVTRRMSQGGQFVLPSEDAIWVSRELGVNVLPLLAGASVVGLAVGFGAQTLVKDIVSGVFFLIDGAFRKGEYIDIGSINGTLEKISVRSMQLRHHRGPLNTVPFGDIGHVTNLSRDWAIMMLPLRLTYDTDAEKARKLNKKLGQKLLEDPELVPQFLQRLKSQGVVQMEDSAQIMSIKFMTRPDDQWMLRRVVFAKIRELFAENGIKFANREVTVRIGEENLDRPLTSEERNAIAGSAARHVADEADAQNNQTSRSRGSGRLFEHHRDATGVFGSDHHRPRITDNRDGGAAEIGRCRL